MVLSFCWEGHTQTDNVEQVTNLNTLVLQLSKRAEQPGLSLCIHSLYRSGMKEDFETEVLPLMKKYPGKLPTKGWNLEAFRYATPLHSLGSVSQCQSLSCLDVQRRGLYHW